MSKFFLRWKIATVEMIEVFANFADSNTCLEKKFQVKIASVFIPNFIVVLHLFLIASIS